jgi:hypothetical protein
MPDGEVHLAVFRLEFLQISQVLTEDRKPLNHFHELRRMGLHHVLMVASSLMCLHVTDPWQTSGCFPGCLHQQLGGSRFFAIKERIVNMVLSILVG